MKIILILLTLIISVFITDRITGRKLINPYKIVGIFGKPGSGKSTLMCKMMYEHVKKGWAVFTDDPSVKIPGVRYFDSEKFKTGQYLPDGNLLKKDIVIFIDEIGILYNNRDFRNAFNPRTLEWWKMHRHYRTKVIYGSQSYKDMDLKLRQLTQDLYLVKRGILSNFSVAKKIFIKMDIANPQGADEQQTGGQIIESYNYDVIFTWKFIFLPKWIKRFNSYREGSKQEEKK